MFAGLPIPPAGFDSLSKEEQLEYLQRLWEYFASDPIRVTVPAWHNEVLDRRRAQQDVATQPWDEVKAEVLGKLQGNALKK